MNRISVWERMAAYGLALGATAFSAGCSSDLESEQAEGMKIRHVLSEVLRDSPNWTTVESRADSAPRLDVIAPSTDLRVDGADLPGLVLSPPCAIELETTAWPSNAMLDLQLGIDSEVLIEHAEALVGHRIEFRISVGGQEIARDSIVIKQVGRKPGTEWKRASCGLVKTGDSVQIRTALLDSKGAEVEFVSPLKVGVGAVELIREEWRSRTVASPDEPNIVLMVMDTQRADRLSTYGYERPTSPRLDGLAARGLVFEQSFATSNWTWPSTASILTGLHPGEHGLVDENSAFLPQSLTMLAEVLQNAGYTTAGWSTNYLLAANRNFDQGFEHYSHAIGHSQDSGEVLPEVLAWLRENAKHKFFLYLHLIDPHAPQSPLPEGRAALASNVPIDFSPTAINAYKSKLFGTDCHDANGNLDTDACVPVEEQQYIQDLYDACVWSGDFRFGQVLDELDGLALTDKTVVVYTSDHGEELFEHGMLTHGHSLHPELTQIPLVMAGPGIPMGQRVTTGVSNRHIAPTLAQLAGTVIPGLSDALFLPEAEVEDSESVFFSTATGLWRGLRRTPIHGVRYKNRVLHWAPKWAEENESTTENGQWKLFDSAKDFGEFEDISELEADVVQDLLKQLRNRLELDESSERVRVTPGGASTLQQLIDLGYMGEE